MKCKNCLYCQIEDKLLCANCDQCPVVSDPSITELQNNSVSFTFKNGILLKPKEDIDVQSFTVGNFDFLNALKEFNDSKKEILLKTEQKDWVKNGKQSQVLDLELFKKEFGTFFNYEFPSNFDEKMLFFYVPKKVENVEVMGAKIEIGRSSSSSPNFTDFFKSTEPLPKENKIIAGGETGNTSKTPTDGVCENPKAHVIKIQPKNIKIGINGILNKNLNLVIISDPQCQVQKVDAKTLIQETSISLVTILVSNFLREMLFSLLNNKDILDIVRYTQTPQTEVYKQFEDFFTTFNCNSFVNFHSDWDSFLSNTFIRSMFIQDYDKNIASRLKDEDDQFWFSEYYKMFKRRFSSSILSGFTCKYNLILPEYLMLFFLVVYVFIKIILEIRLHYEALKSKPCAKKILVLKKIANSFHLIFFNSLLFVYFYNLISFCVLLKLVPTIQFGLIDHIIMSVRAAFVVYPMFKFLKDYNRKTKEIKEKEEKRKRKMEKEKIKKEKPETDKKVIMKNFTKIMPTKRIYGFWEQKKNEIKAFVRISFIGRNSRPNKPSTKKKILRYNLLIINDKQPMIKDTEPEPSKSHPFLQLRLIPSKSPRTCSSRDIHKKRVALPVCVLLE
jgi:hypothetical protein